MWLWRWWRWWIGEVTFCAYGGLCEEFLNRLLEEERVALWNVQMKEDQLTACCRVSAYRAVRRPARHTGTRVRAVEKRGFAFRFQGMRKRFGLLIGAMAAMVLYMTLSSYIWVIDIQTDDPLVASHVEKALAASGLSVGTASRDIDLPFVRINTLVEWKQLHNVGVYLDGCVAHVEVREEQEHTLLPDSSPSNVVASCDGRIVQMMVTSGQAMVKEGDAVVKGDLLVCGAIETNNGVLLKHAAATVTAETTRVLETEVPMRETVFLKTQTPLQTHVRFLWWEVPVWCGEAVLDQPTEERYTPLVWMDTALPIGVKQMVQLTSTATTLTYTKEQAAAVAKRRLQARAASELADAEIRSVRYEAEEEGDVYRLRAVYSCVEDIAVQTPLLTDFA